MSKEKLEALVARAEESQTAYIEAMNSVADNFRERIDPVGFEEVVHAIDFKVLQSAIAINNLNLNLSELIRALSQKEPT